MSDHPHECYRMRYGLIGRSLAYSFSPEYFRKKWALDPRNDHRYHLINLSHLGTVDIILHRGGWSGINVTIPYKLLIIPYLAGLSPEAQTIGAVNTLVPYEDGWWGFNTDYIGYRDCLRERCKPTQIDRALLLGTGGAARAVRYALDQLGINYTQVSRRPEGDQIGYDDIDKATLRDHRLIIHTTPVGTWPSIEERIDIPYHHLSEKHILSDLIYHPSETAFLRAGRERGCRCINGQRMLEIQADHAWNLWTHPPHLGH